MSSSNNKNLTFILKAKSSTNLTVFLLASLSSATPTFLYFFNTSIWDCNMLVPNNAIPVQNFDRVSADTTSSTIIAVSLFPCTNG